MTHSTTVSLKPQEMSHFFNQMTKLQRSLDWPSLAVTPACDYTLGQQVGLCAYEASRDEPFLEPIGPSALRPHEASSQDHYQEAANAGRL